MLTFRPMAAAASIAIGLTLTTSVRAGEQAAKPLPPETIRMLETPAEVSVKGTTLHVDGTILDQAVTEVEHRLREAGETPIRGLVIKSPGGEANAGIRFGEIVRDWKLAVTVDRSCMSSCANYVALAANELFVPDGAVLGYHGGARKIWDENGEFPEAYKETLRRNGIPDRFFPSMVEGHKKSYERQQALFQSIGVSPSILEDSADSVFTMFTRDAMERCYGVKNIKQYPALAGDEIVQGETKIKIVRDCRGKAP